MMNCFVYKNEKRKDVYKWYLESMSDSISTLTFEIIFASQQSITNEKLLLTGYLATFSVQSKVEVIYTNLVIEEAFKVEFEHTFGVTLKSPLYSVSSKLLEYNCIEEFKNVLQNHTLSIDTKVKSTEKVFYVWTSSKDVGCGQDSFPPMYQNTCLCGSVESLSGKQQQEKFKKFDTCFKRTQVLFYEILYQTGQNIFSQFYFSFIPLLFFLHEYISEIVFVVNGNKRLSVNCRYGQKYCRILFSILEKCKRESLEKKLC